MAHNVQNVTLALTLPITCHICLGKVRQPVICANYHVFCSVCIEMWLKKNSQCPACRVPITEENPCKNIIGGTSEDEGTLTHAGRKHLRKTRLELLQKDYEEEIESLLQETEELKRANVQLEERLRAASDPAVSSISCTCGSKESGSIGMISDSLLDEWSRKLEMANVANKKVLEDNENVKEENRKLRNENIKCIRENLRLKNEVDLRSPQKFGRFTVAALQAKVDQYEREMSRLKKALERCDQYIEELEAEVEQLKRPSEDILKEESQCGEAAHVHRTDATTTQTCQELKATQQFLSHSHKTGVLSEEFSSKCCKSNRHSSSLYKLKSVCEHERSPEQKSKFSRHSCTVLNNNEQMSMDGESQVEGAELAQGFGSPSLSLPLSSLYLNTPGGKANSSSNHGPLKKPLTFLRRLVFDDLPKKKELSKSNSSNCENNMDTDKGLASFGEPKPCFLNLCQDICESGDSKLQGQRDTGLQFGKEKDNTFQNSLEQSSHVNVSEINTAECSKSWNPYQDDAPSTSGTKINFPSHSKVKESGGSPSTYQGGEPIASASCAPCSSSAVCDGEDSKFFLNRPADAIQDTNFQGHLPNTDIVSCKSMLEAKEELLLHDTSGEAGHTSKLTRLSHGVTYSDSPSAKRKITNWSSDSPSKSLKR
ncbi:ORC ubiquitin ligase 1 [Leptodactylus fuscus]|uniref:ORC ubiquitin ligase 1 n=1 Tax=Leptodactylus fuscus TaxID=238119 RepID=UPI003F4E536E